MKILNDLFPLLNLAMTVFPDVVLGDAVNIVHGFSANLLVERAERFFISNMVMCHEM